MIQVSVILPVKPPEPYLSVLISEIHHVLNNTEHEILIQTESGLGHAVSRGIQNSSGKTVVIMDADGSHNPVYIPEMLKLLQINDIVIGSRFCKGGKTLDVTHRKWLSLLYRYATKLLLKVKVEDSMSGFVVAKKEVFNNYKFHKGYKFLLPLLVQNPKHKIVEHPITFENRKAGKSKAGVKEGIRTLLLILKLFIHKLGKTEVEN